ncbi:MAG: sporulation specific N-acetylmuramoyl-L-alanine amidase [Symbiobacteriaceae bacterium]|jgi:N-acetylmuramoyl-L-alanine amidase|nr:sporulation specific N-acetylmuramoyl-L-alanine amidase [Symbiobacteriaceae bacterium]
MGVKVLPKLIVIDPGHDTDDPGSTQIDGAQERTYTLPLALATRDALLRGWDCEVVLTHEGPGMVPGGDLAAELRARGELPNQLGADFFISLHHNAGPSSARGGELYIWTSKRNANGGLVWLPAIDPATGLPNHEAPRSYAIAQVVQPAIRDALAQFGIPWRGAPDRIMCADFAVLRYPELPCMLVESHFGTNQQDDDVADSPEFIPTLAQAIASSLAQALRLTARPEEWQLPRAKVLLPTRPGDDAPREIFGEIRDGVTYAVLPGMSTEVPVRAVAEAMGRTVRFILEPPTVIIE